MTLKRILSRIEEALMSAPERRARHERSPCPECDDKGPHESNGHNGYQEAFACRACGLHFDAHEWE